MSIIKLGLGSIRPCRDCGMQFCECKKNRRNEISQKYYGIDYDSLCSRRKKIIDDSIGIRG